MIEKGAAGQAAWPASGSWERQNRGLPLGPLERNAVEPTFSFEPSQTASDIRPTE